MAGTDDDGFIGMPPGIFDSGTFKLPPKPERARVERDEIVFVSAVPGMPLPEPGPAQEPEPVTDEAAPEAAAPEAPSPAASLEDAQSAPVSYETRRAVPDPADSPDSPTATGWVLTLADGSEAPVGSTLLIGRNPAPFDAWPGAALLSIEDPTHSVSKTHAAFELDDSGLWVHDLNSTNGVWVVRGEDVTEVAPGRRVAVKPGSSVELGDYVLTVRR
ncbi:MAG: FHA domain-containing protein [Protaetiibacter sp.]